MVPCLVEVTCSLVHEEVVKVHWLPRQHYLSAVDLDELTLGAGLIVWAEYH